MTIAYYYTPNGTCIHGEGIAPDVEVELPEDATEDVQLAEAISYLQTK
jgi:carboxyl-terminal processing protease